MSTEDQTEAAKEQECQTATVEEAATVLGIGRNTAYEGIRSGEIPSIRVGRRVLVPKAALARLLEGAQRSA